MPASLPGATAAENAANPTQGKAIIMDAYSGPKGSPNDAKKFDYSTGTPPGWSGGRPILIADAANLSTGALSTGIGFGANYVTDAVLVGTRLGQFTDDYAPGVSTPVPAAASNSRFMYIGGGKSAIQDGTGAGGNGYPAGTFTSQPVPYTAGFGIASAGGGGARESTTLGFGMKVVTAAGAVADQAVVETGFVNRSGAALVTGNSVIGVASAALAAPA